MNTHRHDLLEGRLLPYLVLTLAALTACNSSKPGPVAPLGSPTAPSELTATLEKQTGVRLRWRDNSDDEVTFEIRRLSHNEPWADVATLATDEITYGDPKLNWETKYYYSVRATNSNGSSLESGTVAITTPKKPALTGGCVIVIGAGLSNSPERGNQPAVAAAPEERLWMLAQHAEQEEVVARAAFPEPATAAELDGGDHTVWMEIEETEDGEGRLTLDFNVCFSALGSEEAERHTDFRLMLMPAVS